MIKIRDVKYKIAGNKILLGVELEPEEWNYYKNSEVKIILLKGNTIVHEEIIVIPTIATEELLYVGKTIDYVDFDKLDFELKLETTEYETSYYPDVVFEIDKERTNDRHLEYKVTNNTNSTFDNATLNLVFYNRGELICGADVKIENVMNGRTYYFSYDIPEEIEYTDITTRLVLPNTEVLLFKGFYEKFINYENAINSIETSTEQKKEKTYENRTDTLKEKIKTKKKMLSSIKREIPCSLFNKLIVSLLILLVGAPLFFSIIKYLLKLLFSMTESDALGFSALICLIVVPCSLMLAWEYISCNYTRKEKKQRIKNTSEEIQKLKTELEDQIKNKEKIINEIDAYNKEVVEYNNKANKTDIENTARKKVLLDEFEAFKSKYPNYRMLETYDELNRQLVNEAIELGAMTVETVENYRLAMLEKIEEERKFQKEIAVKEEQNKLLAEQNKELSLDRMQREQAHQEEMAQQQSIAAQNAFMMQEQINAEKKLYRQREYYGNQINNAMYDLKNQAHWDSIYNR